MQPDKLGKASLLTLSKESGCHGKDEDVLEEMAQKSFTLKQHSDIFFHDIESAKDKMLEDGPNLERNIIFQSIEKMLTPNRNLYDEKKASAVKTPLDNFFYKEIKHFNSQCF